MVTLNKPPTLRQLEVLRFISERIQDGLPPTFREIGERLGIASSHGVADHLEALTKKGLLERDHVRARAMRVTKLGQKYLRVAA